MDMDMEFNGSIDVDRLYRDKQIDMVMRSLVDPINVRVLRGLIDTYYEGMESGEDVTDLAIAVIQGGELSKVIREHEDMKKALKSLLEKEAVSEAESGLGDTVVMSKELIDDLTESKQFLECLEACGVDNWRGYGDARQMLQEEAESNED